MVDAREAVIARPPRFNPFSAEFRADPYASYRAVRDAGCVRTLGTVVLARHAQVSAALRSRALGVDLIPAAIERHGARLGVADTRLAQRFMRNSLVFTDNPRHTRLRRLLGQVYTPAAIEALRPVVRYHANVLLASTRGESFDIAGDFACRLPYRVLGAWMGLPADRGEWVRERIHDARLLLDPGVSAKPAFERALIALDDLVRYFTEHVVRAGDAGRAPLVEALLAARVEGGGLDAEEAAFACIMSFVAGGETAEALVGNTVHLLLDHPEQLARVRAEPDRWLARAIEEATRHETPLQLTKRVALEDTSVARIALRAGEQVLLCLGGANRDPEVFEDPDRFDIARTGPPHVGYGYGMHACLGAALARMQAEVALAEVLGRFACLHRHGPSVWQAHSLILRGPCRLPVAAGTTACATPERSPTWLRTEPRREGAAAHLVCFPHAGGSAASFAGWRRSLGPRVAVHRAELPRLAHPADAASAPTLAEAAGGIARAIGAALASGAIGTPCAFYGHSLGALVAYEVARALRRAGESGPVHLFVSGRRAPCRPLRRQALCDMPETQLRSVLATFDPEPDRVLSDDRWFRALLPDLRWQLALSDRHAAESEVAFDCPIDAFMGEDDPILATDELAAWAAHTSGPFRMRRLPGAHFFTADGTRTLQQAIVATLLEPVPSEAACG